MNINEIEEATYEKDLGVVVAEMLQSTRQVW